MSSKTPQPSNPATTSQVTPESTDKDGDIAMGGIEDPKEITVTETLKVALPDRFTGNRQELETFLLQLEIYFQFNQDKFNHDADKSVWAASYLRGEAAKWVQPYLKDYFTNLSEPKKRMYPTQTIFGRFEGFKKEIRRVFGNINELRDAESKIYGLKQTGSAVKYAVEFRRYIGTTGWEENAMMSHYRKGLKPEVRLELDRNCTWEDLNELIEESIKADEMLYEYQKARRSSNFHGNRDRGKYHKNEGRPREIRQSYGEPMQLDAKFKNKLPKEEVERRRKDKLCFECGKPGHRARDCRSKRSPGGGYHKKFGKGQLNATFVPQLCASNPIEDDSYEREERQKEIDAMSRDQEGLKAIDRYDLERLRTPSPPLIKEDPKEIPSVEHATMSWIACYDESCRIHLSDKEATGWFPQRKAKGPYKKGRSEKISSHGHLNGQLHKIDQIDQIDHNKVLGQGQLNIAGQAGQIYWVAKIKGQIIRAMIDSGATGNFIAPKTAKYLGVQLQTKQTPYQLQLVDGQLAGLDGKISQETRSVQMIIDQHKEIIQFDVVPLGNQSIILGMPWLKAHNLQIDWLWETVTFPNKSDQRDTLEPARLNIRGGELKANSTTNVGRPVQGLPLTAKEGEPPVQMKNKQKKLLKTTPVEKQDETPIPVQYQKYKKLFEERKGHEALPEHKPWDHEIVLEEGKMPPFGPIYPISASDLRTLRNYIGDALEKGWIRESTSQTASPVLFVPKKDSTRRLCVDYHKLNDITIKDRYLLPLATELRDRLGKAKIFSKFDLRNGFHLIRMKEGEEWKTAFRTRYGLYEYQVMPFGLTNAPATCMHLVNNVLRKYLDICCICYLDDILVFSETEEQYVKDVQKVYNTWRKQIFNANLASVNFTSQKRNSWATLYSPEVSR
ncbi:hypothetical protein sscle_15g104250 [Sclerotinia sclerotiorum 1980 UF-70]|uniref:Reverse transcriptase n=1 Tax=Sclerotinia sclerotiorum (strain ATCC 18683 / 1980 / Ss-1) TaxID=665079 RepID=A0A1D9QL32_SCLS1|nr:hypothetical protein sscle_15g104250 [Sclerotinia sclerotiorum 1980 UF-70]